LVKIWNTDSQECIHTFDSGYILCLEFLPGNRYVVAGTKNGDLELFDLSSGSMILSVKAHDGAIWSLSIKPDKTGLVTGSQDKKVKFWDFRLLEDQGTVI
jgi:U3 small nucleolar RNA-associated protein 12